LILILLVSGVLRNVLNYSLSWCWLLQHF